MMELMYDGLTSVARVRKKVGGGVDAEAVEAMGSKVGRCPLMDGRKTGLCVHS